MDNILSSILTDPSYSNYIQTYLSDWDRENLIRLASTINKKVLYSSHFHGLHHSEKVMLNAYVMTLEEVMTQKIIFMAIPLLYGFPR